MESFGWAVIGSGYIVKKVLREITKNKEHSVISIYSHNNESAMKISSKYGGKVFTDFDQAILAPGVQCVYIATPNSSHLYYLNRCIELGVPVLCEKPIVMNTEELNKIIEKAENNKVYFSEVMSFKFSPIYQEFHNMVNIGLFGDLKKIQIDFGFDALSITKRKYLLSPKDGGGALMDIGVYLISFVEDFLGYTNDISNKAVFYKKQVDIIDDMTLVYKNIKCHLSCYFNQITKTQAELVFKKGNIIIPRFFQPYEIYICQDEKNIVLREPFSYKYQFDCVKRDIQMKRSDNHIHTKRAIINTMKMIDQAKSKITLHNVN